MKNPTRRLLESIKRAGFLWRGTSTEGERNRMVPETQGHEYRRLTLRRRDKSRESPRSSQIQGVARSRTTRRFCAGRSTARGCDKWENIRLLPEETRIIPVTIPRRDDL